MSLYISRRIYISPRRNSSLAIGERPKRGPLPSPPRHRDRSGARALMLTADVNVPEIKPTAQNYDGSGLCSRWSAGYLRQCRRDASLSQKCPDLSRRTVKSRLNSDPPPPPRITSPCKARRVRLPESAETISFATKEIRFAASSTSQHRDQGCAEG
jgi:hypothetical protein